MVVVVGVIRDGRRRHFLTDAFAGLGDDIGHGSTTQVVLPQARIDAGFDDLRRRWDAHQEGR